VEQLRTEPQFAVVFAPWLLVVGCWVVGPTHTHTHQIELKKERRRTPHLGGGELDAPPGPRGAKRLLARIEINTACVYTERGAASGEALTATPTHSLGPLARSLTCCLPDLPPSARQQNFGKTFNIGLNCTSSLDIDNSFCNDRR
jgi:hypothetical protein